MTSPHPSRSRLSRSSLSTPDRNAGNSISGSGSRVLQSPSTPYELYQRNHSPLPSTSSASPRSKSAFLPVSSSQPHLAAYRKNAGFGSPGVGKSPRYTSAGVGTSTEMTGNGSQRVLVSRTPKFIRRKSLKQKFLELPETVYDWIIFSPLLDFGDPAIGYPAGLLLHLLSLATLVIHPDGPLHLSLDGKNNQRKAKGLFADQNGGGGLASRRRQAQDDAWRWFATMITFILLIAAFANAYHLFTARRRYHLWLKSTSEKVASDNASLVELPHAIEEDQRAASIHDRLMELVSKTGLLLLKGFVFLIDQALHHLRQIPYLGVVIRFLFPPTLSRRMRHSPSAPLDNQMHAIDMWTAPDVQLRIFCLYSPLHALFYTLHLKSSRGFSHFIMIFALMAIASAQITLLVHFYTGLVKDKNIIAGEVLHEYDVKVVLAKSSVRDASTMTDEAEMSSRKRMSWLNRRRSSDGEKSDGEHSTSAAKRKVQRAPRKTHAL